MPYSSPFSFVTGMAGIDFALFVCKAAQARLTVTAPDRAGGVS